MLDRLYNMLVRTKQSVAPTRLGAYANWAALVKSSRKLWNEKKKSAAAGPYILIATSHAMHAPSSVLESLLAAALTLRGARVRFLLCDGILPACLISTQSRFSGSEFLSHGPTRVLCPNCFRDGIGFLEPLGLEVLTLGGLLDADAKAVARSMAANASLDEMSSMVHENIPVGEHASAGALRFFARGDLNNEPQGEATLRRYFEAALLTSAAVRHCLSVSSPQCAVFNHGIYVPQGIIGAACRERGVPVVNWNPSYRKKTFIFSHGDTYHHTLLSEPVEEWLRLPWTDLMEKRILAYLESRHQGTKDWIWFHEKPNERIEEIVAELGVDRDKPIYGMLSNVIWDAQLHYRANAFANMMEWAVETVRYFSTRPELQLVIRIHPAEIRGTIPSRQPLEPVLREAFPRWPKNVFIVGAASPVSTYAVMGLCSAVMIYGTKTGVELTSVGIPVIVAGEAWIRNKGLTLDASSKDEYKAILDRLPDIPVMTAEQIQLARKYAYHFFFRRMIPLGCVDAVEGKAVYKAGISSLDELMPGQDAGLDVICNGILRGTPFCYPAEYLEANGQS